MSEALDHILQEFLVELQENLERLDRGFVGLEQNPGDKELLADIFRTVHGIKGSAGFLNLSRLERIAHAAEDVLGKLREGTLSSNELIINILLEAVDSIRAILRYLEQSGDEGEYELHDLILSLQQISQGQVPQPESQGDPVTEEEHTMAPTEELRTPDLLQKTKSGNTKSPPIHASTTESPEANLAGIEDSRIHVDVTMLDHLMNLTGELVLSRNQVLRMATDSGENHWMNAAQRLNGIVSELQESMMKTRMQELRKVFGLFPRLVRDVSKQRGKDVQLDMEGHQTELDRSLIEALRTPLMHLVRNAIDHGLETPDIRRQEGKNPKGSILIRAYHDSGQVNIDISDDGAGIDLDLVRQKALQKGIFRKENIEQVSDEKLLDVIFQPGFSTAETVTELSGRGVGMDAVKRHLNRIGGTIEIDTERGQGTTFKIHVPMTLAIVPGLLVASGNRHFVIPQRNLEELVRLDTHEKQGVKSIGSTEVYRLRGELLPLVRLHKLLQLPETERETVSHDDSKQWNPHIIILRTGDKRFGLVVDMVSDTEEIVVKPLGRHIKQEPCYDGATILGNGNVALILNVRALFAAGQFSQEEIQQAQYGHTTETPQTETEQEHRSTHQAVVLFQAGEEEFYGVPLAFVERIETFAASQIEHSGGQEVMQYRGDVLPLMRLEPLLNLTSPPDAAMLSLLVFSVEKDIGLVVQQVINTVEIDTQIDTKSFQRKGVLGSTIIEGHSVLLLDVHGLIELAYPHWYQQFFVSRLKEEERRTTRVLLVEDSKFFMNIEKSYLESAGYQVFTAENGQIAQERLAELSVDVVVTDLDMPYCDGFELTEAIRQHQDWKDMPVMAVTSLSDERDRQKGMSAGIDEYRLKLDRDDVLGTLEKLILRKRKEK